MNTREEARVAIEQAKAASRRGDLAAAERWGKVAEKLSAAAAELANVKAPEPDWREVEAIRAELRARVLRFVEAAQANEAWEAKRSAGVAVGEKPYSDEALEAIGAGRD